MSDFNALVATVTDGKVIDFTAALALADYLSERGDERGDRLRRRTRQCERVVNSLDADMNATRRQLRIGFESYLFRLLASEPGSKLPRPTVSESYVLREPTC